MIPAGIFLLALALRLGYIAEAHHSPLFSALGLDAKYYDDEALRILAGRLPREPYFMGPLYSYFLAAVYSIAGHSYAAVRVLQAFIGAATALAAWGIARRIAGGTAAVLAGLLVASYPPLIFYSGSILYPVLAALLDTAAIYFLVEHARTRRARDLALAGAFLGLSAVGQATVLAVAPGVLVWLWFLEGRDARRALARAIPFALALAATILPVTARNIVIGGEPVLLTSNGGLNFYIGNGPEATGGYVKPKGLDVYEDPSGRRMMERRAGRALTSREVDRIWLDAGMDAVQKEPARFASLLLRKTVFYWGAIEIPQIESFEFQKTASRIVTALDRLPVSFGLLGPLGGVGVVIALWESRRRAGLAHRLAPPLLFVGLYSATIVLFFVISRYRLPMLPAILVFAAIALERSARAARALVRARAAAPRAESGEPYIASPPRLTHRVLAACAVTLVALSLLVNANPYGVSKTSGFGQVHYRLGIIARQAGRIEDALAEYRRSIEYDPDYAPARMNLAEILLAKQDLDGALVELREAARIDPEYGRARYNLGLTLALLGDWAAAGAEFEESARLAPQSSDGWFGAGAARFVAGDLAGARAAFETMGARASAAAAALAQAASPRERADPGERSRGASARAAAERAKSLIALVDREADLERAAPLGSASGAHDAADSPDASGPSPAAAARRLARVASLWLVAGDRARAAAVAQSLPAIDDPVVFFHRGDLLVAMRRIDEGEALLRRALALAPRLPHAHASLAAARQLAGDRYGAYQELRAELETNPGNQDARRMLDEAGRR